MKRFNLFLSVFTLVLGFSFLTQALAQDSTQTKAQVRTKAQYRKTVQSQSQTGNAVMGQFRHGNKFVDVNGDGINDNAPDADGDGIPNGMDPDYTGAKMRSGNGAKGFIDLNGDGINDNALDADGDNSPDDLNKDGFYDDEIFGIIEAGQFSPGWLQNASAS